MKKRVPYLVASIIVLFLLPKTGASQKIHYRTRDVATSLNSPWELRWGYDGWIWATERLGKLDRFNPETGEKHIVLSESDCYQLAEAGMLGFDFHPDFPATPYLYVIFTNRDSVSRPDTIIIREKLYRYTYDVTKDTLVDRVMLFDRIQGALQHNGSRVKIGPDRKIYISTGETYFKPYLAQEDTSANGKILRLNLDGSIPEDNPWPGSPVWSKGHRNPQGLVFGPNGLLYESEHGDATDDELNIITKGSNGGWPDIAGFCDTPEEMAICDSEKVSEPIYAWTPTQATSGIDFYDKGNIPEWENSILIATLKDTSILQVALDDSRMHVKSVHYYPMILSESGVPAGRLRDFCISPEGRVFVSTSNIWSPDWSPDRIFEVIRTGVVPDDIALNAPTNESIVATTQVPLSWHRSADIPNTSITYELQFSTDSAFAKVVSDTKSLKDTTAIIGLVAETDYFWRVRGIWNDTTNGDWSDTYKFTYQSAAVAAHQLRSAFMIFPNPAHEKVSFAIAGHTNSPVTVQVYDLLGHKLQEKVYAKATNGLITFDCSMLEVGNYILRTISNEDVTSFRFLKK